MLKVTSYMLLTNNCGPTEGAATLCGFIINKAIKIHQNKYINRTLFTDNALNSN